MINIILVIGIVVIIAIIGYILWSNGTFIKLFGSEKQKMTQYKIDMINTAFNEKIKEEKELRNDAVNKISGLIFG